MRTKVITGTREQWLLDFTELCRAWFVDTAGIRIPDTIRASCGFPSKGARGAVLGQCWHPPDKAPQIFISPLLSDTLRVADVTVHELIHTALPAGTGHRKPFERAARALHLGGEVTATTGSPALTKVLKPMLKQLGPYPHDALDPGGQRKQATRLLKASCPECGLVFRITQRWVDASEGDLFCPNHFAHGDDVRMDV